MRPSSLLVSLLAGGQALAAPHEPESSKSRSLEARDSSPSLNAFLAAITALFPVNVTVDAACGLITSAGTLGTTVFGLDDDENDPCGDVTLVFVRGTCEPGNVGVFVGPWFIKSLEDILAPQTLGVIGFDYAASVVDYLDDSETNGVNLANMLKDIVSQCPNTKIVIGGYDQGAMVVHDAAADLDAATMARVFSIVLFGDPDSQEPVSNIDPDKVKVYCNVGDDICDDGPIVSPTHLTYALNAADAAAFVAIRLTML